MARTYENPVYGAYFADPFVFGHDGTYFAVGTGPGEAGGAASGLVFPLLTSRDLVHWRPLGAALRPPMASYGDTFWAPEIVRREDTWYLYYSVGRGDAAHQIRVATSHAPEGPYDDRAALTHLGDCPFAIDPHVFHDDDGRDYLFFARDFLDTEGGARVGTALSVAELVAMDRLGDVTTVLRAHHDWQRFMANRPMYGAHYDWHTLEGPSVIKHQRLYYCLYSGGSWQNESYGVDYAVAEHVRGPYSDVGAEGGARVLRTVPGRVIGPGHNSVFVAPDGSSLVIAYHAWSPGMDARRFRIDGLRIDAGVVTSDGPTSEPRQVPWR